MIFSDADFRLSNSLQPSERMTKRCSAKARADAMVASPSFSKVPPMKHATLIAFPSAVKVTVSTGGLAGLSSFAGTPSKNDLWKRVVSCCVFIFDQTVANYPFPTLKR